MTDRFHIISLSAFLYSILNLGHKIAFCPIQQYREVQLNSTFINLHPDLRSNASETAKK